MRVNLADRTSQVVLYLLVQCICLWVLTEARTKQQKADWNKKIQKKAHRNHRPCTGEVGEQLSDNSCDRCRCVYGITRCHRRRCPSQPITCVDSVTPTDGCCTTPTCPNGPNCWHKGKKINGRKLHRETNYENGCIEICSCPPPWKVEYDSETSAECKTHCPIRNFRGKREVRDSRSDLDIGEIEI